MKAFTALIFFALVACAMAGILSPYVGYSGYYPGVSGYYPSAVAPVGGYYSAGVYAPGYVGYSGYGGHVAYTGYPGYTAPVAYSPYAAYSYLLKK